MADMVEWFVYFKEAEDREDTVIAMQTCIDKRHLCKMFKTTFFFYFCIITKYSFSMPSDRNEIASSYYLV